MNRSETRVRDPLRAQSRTTRGSFGGDWLSTVIPRISALANGLRLVSVGRPGAPTVAVRAYVRAGSRYDVEHRLHSTSRSALGLAHLTEHLLFQGTRSHSQRELFARVEQFGGALDAGTAKEYATVGAVMPRQGLPTALAILAEVLTEPALREADLRREKLVILEEIRRAGDGRGVIHDLFARALWRHHPFRHPVHGTLKALCDLDRAAVLAFHRQRYVAGNTVLSVSGDVEHEEVRRLVEAQFDSLPRGPEQPPIPTQEHPPSEARTAHQSKDIGQTLLLTGVPTVAMGHEDRWPLKVIERVLGMGGSARLYQRLREEMKLVYSVRTVTAHYEDIGFFAVQTACAPENTERVRQAVEETWEELRQDGVTEDDLRAAKRNYAGTLARRFETNRALAGIFGIELLLRRVEPFGEALRRIDAVGCDDVVRAAQTYLDADRSVTVSVGRG